MDVGLLNKLFGKEQQWLGPCTVILEAEASVQTAGNDALGGGGLKAWAPRTVSGRIAADSVCLLKDGSAVVMLQQARSKSATGDEVVKNTITVADPGALVALEFNDLAPQMLHALGISMPPVKTGGSHSGIKTAPRPAVT